MGVCQPLGQTPPSPCPAADLDGKGKQRPSPGALVQQGHWGCGELRLPVNEIGVDAGEDAVIHQEQGAPLQDRAGEQGLPSGFLREAGVGLGEDSGQGEECAWERVPLARGRSLGPSLGGDGPEALGQQCAEPGSPVPHLQLGLQTGPGAQHWSHHVISDGEVLWEVATAADQDRVEAIQELGGEEGVLLPVFQRVLWGKGGGGGGPGHVSPEAPSGSFRVELLWVCPGLPLLFTLYLSQPGLQSLPFTKAARPSPLPTCPAVSLTPQAQDSAASNAPCQRDWAAALAPPHSSPGI